MSSANRLPLHILPLNKQHTGLGAKGVQGKQVITSDTAKGAILGPVEDECAFEKSPLVSDAHDSASQMPEWFPASCPPGVKDFN